MRQQGLTRWLAVVIVLVVCGCNKTASDSATTNTATESAASNTANGGVQGSGAENKAAPTPKPKPAAIVVDAGTVIEVSIDQEISSKAGKPGDRFDASIAAPVVVGEKVAIPKGAKATVSIADAKTAGRIKGSAGLGVVLDSITVKGKTYQVQTAAVEEEGSGRGKRTIIGAGGGAAVGALIGGLTGGGKGAAIGAGAGGGAGTAGAALTGNRDITIPAETKLSFTLNEVLRITGN